MNKQLTIVIPAYNEESSLSRYLSEVTGFCDENAYDLIIVDDGSKDKTHQIIENAFEKTAYKLIHHKLNKGYGSAIKAGIKQAETDYVITIDADGQHQLTDVKKLLDKILETDADMIVGKRKSAKSTLYRNLGRWTIKKIAGILLPLPISDLNSGMKIYRSDLAKEYIKICPDTMAFSDVITLVFIQEKNLVLEEEIEISERLGGESTINTMTAVDTVKEILNIVMLFNPMRIFFPLSVFFVGLGFLWGIPFILLKRGVSTGSLMAVMIGMLFFLLGLIAEQLSQIRKGRDGES